MLAELPRRQRQAFVLHVLEELYPAEIAMTQDWPEQAVTADPEAERQVLRSRLAEAGYLEEEPSSEQLPTERPEGTSE